MHYLVFFAGLEESVQKLQFGNPAQRLSTRDLLLVCSAALAVAVLLFMWAYFIRKRRDERQDRSDPSDALRENSSLADGERRKRRRRKRRRPHRPRNPSLQQTGGLPPPRTEDEPPKY